MSALTVGLRRIRPPSIDVRVVAGIVLVAVSVVGGLRMTRGPAPGTAVFVAAAALDAGHVLTRGDLSEVEVRAPGSLIAGLERADRGAPIGRVLRTPVRAGAPIPLDALGGAMPAGRDVTIPVTAEHALGGAIRPGDRLDVYATFDKGTDVARTLTVARRATVRGVLRSDGLFGQQEGAITAITLAVDPDAAIAVAFAARNGELDVVRARGTLDGRGRDRFDAGLTPMSEGLPVIVCAGGAAWEVPLLRGLQRPELGVRVVQRCVDHGDLLGTALRDRPRAVVIDAALGWVDRDLVATLRRAGIEVVGVGGRPGRRDELGIIGVEDTAAAEELALILDRLGPASEVVAQDEIPGAGRLVAVWGAAGAPGRTTVAVHLAIESARRGRSTLLVDGDAWAASVAQLLELAESPSVAQAARLAGHGWPTALAGCLQAGPDGLHVLAGLPRAELWPEVTPEAWRAVLAAATETFEVVVVDVAAPVEEDEELVVDRLPFRRNLMTTVALDHADPILLVASADPVGLRRGVIAHRQLADRAPSRASEVSVVLNRMPRSARHAQDCSRAVESWVGRPPTALLPFEPTFARVVWEGRTLHAVAPRSQWLRELRDLLGRVGR